jgi:hypothetical protein
MNTAKVVVHVVESNRGNVIFKLLRKRIGEASEATHRHPHSKVLPLHIAKLWFQPYISKRDRNSLLMPKLDRLRHEMRDYVFGLLAFNSNCLRLAKAQFDRSL